MRAAAVRTRPVRLIALALTVALGAVSALLLGPRALLVVPGLCIGPDCAAAATTCARQRSCQARRGTDGI